MNESDRASLNKAIEKRVNCEKATFEAATHGGEIAVVRALQKFADERGEKELAESYDAVAKWFSDAQGKATQDLLSHSQRVGRA
jgi:hypothetical protein